MYPFFCTYLVPTATLTLEYLLIPMRPGESHQMIDFVKAVKQALHIHRLWNDPWTSEYSSVLFFHSSLKYNED